jgi:ATP-dependent DNA helicase RecG
MKSYSAQELYKLLCESDESVWIEAKGEADTNQSLMESVCSFSNEPGLGGGYILYGIGEHKGAIGKDRFVVEGVTDCDKAQSDISTQCGSMFNAPARPRIEIEQLEGKNILKIFVPELPSQQKPLYFHNKGLPQGAWRRIGSTDQRCTEEDLYTFYQDNTSFDSSVIKNTSFEDIDLKAVEYYRKLRKEVNPKAEELNYDDQELLRSLECITKDGCLTFAGIMLFGTKQVIRRFYPLMRTDYIRVRGNEWVENVDERFSAIEFMGPLMLQIDRMIDAVLSDLPQNFSLKEGQIYATTKPDLPERVIREAIVNAVMHRSYHHNRPTQIIRYNNRIEITNSGYSLKAQDEIGTAGSDTRNQLIASIFHETNLAEFKGTGIRTMRRLMSEAGLSMPTFESNRKGDTFTIRLLLHKFFSEDDMKWLEMFESVSLTENQKSAIIFAREIGAVDTLTYTQLTGEKPELAENSLEELEKTGILIRKGKTLEATYYVLNKEYLGSAENEMSPNVPKKSEKMSPNVPKKSLTEREKRIVELIFENKDVTTKKIAEELKVTEKTIKRDISDLKDKLIIERVGGKNGGYWKILK